MSHKDGWSEKQSHMVMFENDWQQSLEFRVMFRVDNVKIFQLSEINILYCSLFILFHKLIQ